MSGPFGAGALNLFSGVKNFYPYEIDHSLRMDDGSAARLSRTPSADGNKKVWTWSAWIKRCKLDTSQIFWGVHDGGSNQCWLGWNSGNTIQFFSYNGSTIANVSTQGKFRDTQSWYHLVVAFDAANTSINMYINGVDQALTTSTAISNTNHDINDSSYLHGIGRAGALTGNDSDMYIAEVNFVDGQALSASNFGETKEGVWIPKEYSGSYGTNGFHLAFGSSSALGDDTSGNTNDYSPTNLGAHDQVEDTPTNNFMTYNNLLRTDYGTRLYEGNMWYNTGGTGGPPYKYASAGTFVGSQATGGKYYWEWYCKEAGLAAVGIFDQSVEWNGGSKISGDGPVVYYAFDGKFANQAARTTYGDTFADGDIIGCAVDFDNRKIWFSKNGTWQNSGDPAAGTNAAGTFADEEYMMAYIEAGSSTDVSKMVLNAGQDGTFAGEQTSQGNSDSNGIGDFYYSPPSGFLAVCSKNWPDPAIDPNADESAGDYFNTVLYTGNQTARTITGVGFQPNWVWAKRRSSTAESHIWVDSVRGATKTLKSNTANPEGTNTQGITGFDADGFDLGTSLEPNTNGAPYVAWNWKAGGTAVSNTDGSITSSVSANTDAGFSIVSYTGTGANGTVGHGLGKAPAFVIVKNRDRSADWRIYHQKLTGDAKVLTFTSNGEADNAATFNSTRPTSAVFSVGTSDNTNKLNEDLIAYCFSEIEGYSKFGVYTGTGASNGPFVYTGFRVAFLMVKTISTNGYNWTMFDNTRDPNNAVDNLLYPNLSATENTGTDRWDFLSNGFKPREGSNDNGDGRVHIYIAFADQPFKYSNAR